MCPLVCVWLTLLVVHVVDFLPRQRGRERAEFHAKARRKRLFSCCFPNPSSASLIAALICARAKLCVWRRAKLPSKAARHHDRARRRYQTILACVLALKHHSLFIDGHVCVRRHFCCARVHDERILLLGWPSGADLLRSADCTLIFYDQHTSDLSLACCRACSLSPLLSLSLSLVSNWNISFSSAYLIEINPLASI